MHGNRYKTVSMGCSGCPHYNLMAGWYLRASSYTKGATLHKVCNHSGL